MVIVEDSVKELVDRLDASCAGTSSDPKGRELNPLTVTAQQQQQPRARQPALRLQVPQEEEAHVSFAEVDPRGPRRRPTWAIPDAVGASAVSAEAALALGLTAADVGEYPVVAQGLQKSYRLPGPFGGETVAVRGLSLALRRGEVFGLLGPNGAGKPQMGFA